MDHAELELPSAAAASDAVQKQQKDLALDESDALLIACKNGDVTTARRIIATGVDVDQADATGTTPLFTACIQEQVELIRMLAASGANVNRANTAQQGYSPLHVACALRNEEVARLLLEVGAEANQEKADGETPLFIACRKTDETGAKVLIDAGADVNHADAEGATPLFVATAEEHVELICMLLNAGADVNKAKRGFSPLHVACALRSEVVARLLLEAGAEMNRGDEDGETPLYISCQNGDEATARLLIEARANVNIATRNGRTPLWQACAGSPAHAIVQLLLKSGADPNQSDEHGLDPMGFASHSGDERLKRMLVDAGALSEDEQDQRRMRELRNEMLLDELRFKHLSQQSQDELRSDRPSSPPIPEDIRARGAVRVRFYNNTRENVMLFSFAHEDGSEQPVSEICSGGRSSDAYATPASKFYAKAADGDLQYGPWTLDDREKQVYFLQDVVLYSSAAETDAAPVGQQTGPTSATTTVYPEPNLHIPSPKSRATTTTQSSQQSIEDTRLSTAQRSCAAKLKELWPHKRKMLEDHAQNVVSTTMRKVDHISLPELLGGQPVTELTEFVDIKTTQKKCCRCHSAGGIVIFKRRMAIDVVLIAGQGTCAVAVTALGSWLLAMVVVGLVACFSCCIVSVLVHEYRRSQDLMSGQKRCDSGISIILGTWLYTSLLFVIPALLFALAASHKDIDQGDKLGTAGVWCMLTMVWLLGWGFLWYRASSINSIHADQHLLEMPSSLLLRLKYVSVLGECYNYCGFSYFPAVPWQAMEVPPAVPHPQTVMLAGLFEFDNMNTHLWTFAGGATAAVVGGLLLWLMRNDPGKKFAVVLLFFDVLSLPVIKTLTGVLSCTSATSWTVKAVGNTRTPALFCDQVSPDTAQCMDLDPSVGCWVDPQHRIYVAVAMALLVPYYLACLQFQITGFARQSVVTIDGTWSIFATQSKFLLAVVASGVGNCYPNILAVCVHGVVCCQLLLLYTGTVYSNVHSLNALRIGGLFCALVNGAFSAFVQWHYKDDPRGLPTCLTKRPAGLDMPLMRPVSSYTTFYCLIGANILAVGSAVAWYLRVKYTWMPSDTTYSSLASVNSSPEAKAVDYPVVQARLRAVERLLKPHSKPFVFDLHTAAEDTGQQLEAFTFNMVLQSGCLSAPHGVRLLSINITQPSGLMVIDAFETMQGVGIRSWATCKLPCCEKKHGVERSWKSCWRPNACEVARVDIGATEFSFTPESLRALASVEGSWWYPHCVGGIERARALDKIAKGSSRGRDFSDDLRSHREFILKAANLDGSVLEHASTELRDDREVVLTSVSTTQSDRFPALKHASAKLRGDKDIVRAAVEHYGGALQYASAELRGDREIVLAAVRALPEALQYASAGLRVDPELMRMGNARLDADVLAEAVDAGVLKESYPNRPQIYAD